MSYFYYLLVYDRPAGELRELHEYPEEQRDDALEAFSVREAQESRNPDIEVALISAESREALRETHGRYFLTVRQLAERMQAAPLRPRTSAL